MRERGSERRRERKTEGGRGKACMYIYVYEIVGMKKGMEGGEEGRR